MKEINLNSWTEFENEIKKLEQWRNEQAQESPFRIAPLYFRGQTNSCWKLETTWERYGGDKTKIFDYYELIFRVKDHVEAFADKKWELPSMSDYKIWLDTYSSLGGGKGGFLGYEYMTYLRHYGFPSPLLDWSKSPYIAAYFAFRELKQDVDKVAIYAYLEHAGIKSAWVSGEPSIYTPEGQVSSHKRHFLQQSYYSICTTGVGSQAYYCCHENVFSEDSKRQDFLWKFTLPYTEQLTVLRKLDAHNVSDYSLFGSEESLMKTAFMRELTLK